MTNEFEIGPIRPPSESKSLLLRVTRNCSWNKCKFCSLYKDHKFSTRSVEDIKADIDRIAQYVGDIHSRLSEQPARSGLLGKVDAFPKEKRQRYLYLLQWISNGEESVFLQDANTLVLSFDKLQEILTHLRKKLPQVKRVTSYGRVDSLSKFSAGQLTELRQAGLDRIHSGYESGSDKVLELINKGYTKAQEIDAGLKVKDSGIELSIYFMPGVGGRDLSESNALETADVINNINPDFVRIRTFVSHLGTGLDDDIRAGRIKDCTDKEKMLELKKMIENITCADGHLFSDHVINLLENVNGNMNSDKAKMLSEFSAFEQLYIPTQKKYQIARRLGMIGSPSDLELLSGEHLSVVNNYLEQLDTEHKFESFILSCLRRYI